VISDGLFPCEAARLTRTTTKGSRFAMVWIRQSRCPPSHTRSTVEPMLISRVWISLFLSCRQSTLLTLNAWLLAVLIPTAINSRTPPRRASATTTGSAALAHSHWREQKLGPERSDHGSPSTCGSGPPPLPLSSGVSTRRDCFFVPEHGVRVSICRTPRPALSHGP
jgi:hypothetical protein